MLTNLFLFLVGFIWVLIVFLDMLFKSCMVHPYFRALYAAGIDIQPFVIFWRITRFNRFINRMGLYRPSFVKAWFHVGAIVTSSIIFPCLLLYAFKLVNLLQSDSPDEFEKSKLVAVIPGYNLALSYWKLYGCVLLICSVIHEFGHALAASRLGISVDSVGFAISLVFPFAFVSLRSDQLKYSSRWQQMCIYCAGIWHNIVLSLSCLFALKFFVLLMSPLFYVGAGVTVLQVNEQSSLYNPAVGLVPGDIIHAVGNRIVKDLDSWNSHLQEIANTGEGFCVEQHLLRKSDDAVAQKCMDRLDHLYFDIKLEQHKIGACLHVRATVNFNKFCQKSSQCEGLSLCVMPYLPEFHKLIVIERRGKPQVLYAGLVSELYADVQVSEFLPKKKFISPRVAEDIKEFLQFLFLFSNGLACLNVLPLYKLDGKVIMENLIHILLHKHFSAKQRRWIIHSISAFSYIVASSIFLMTIYQCATFYM